MRNIIFIISIFTSIICVSQNNDEKETVYLLFNEHSLENCKVSIEGKRDVKKNKFIKEYQGEYILFKICDEVFSTHKTKSFKDTCSIKALDNLKIVDINYLKYKYNSSNDFKHHVFEKIFFIEKLPNNIIIKYQVYWIDEITMIDD